MAVAFPRMACHGSTLAVGLRRRALGPGAGLCCAEAAAGGVVTQRSRGYDLDRSNEYYGNIIRIYIYM